MANDGWWLPPTLQQLIAADPAPAAGEQSSAQIYWLLGVVIGLLAIAYAVSVLLKRYPEGTLNPALVERFIHRIRAWWIMCAILVAGFLLGRVATVVLFGAVSFWSLREFITATPTRRGDHRTLFWVFFGFTPLQYVLVGLGWDLYGVYSIVIPVYAFLFIPARNAVAGDPKRFLERSAKIQAGLLICVYALSFAPALLNLPLTRSNGAAWGRDSHLAAAGLLFYLVLLTQLADVFQTAWSRLLGRRVIAPAISATRTWEGFLGGVTSTTLIGSLLWWATPFRFWEAACMSMIVAVTAFAGNMVMSAIKRDRNVADFGTLVQGHPGVLDRIDSLCFAAPLFYHLTRYFFSELA
ncbi:MAG: phosphatidate cytidylyltransferase [Candidatus Anammoximicrobium sp.]|nr:phosphatidate cytidylyltransferase [Candidatus Anammoximicrobium sp.]